MFLSLNMAHIERSTAFKEMPAWPYCLWYAQFFGHNFYIFKVELRHADFSPLAQ